MGDGLERSRFHHVGHVENGDWYVVQKCSLDVSVVVLGRRITIAPRACQASCVVTSVSCIGEKAGLM